MPFIPESLPGRDVGRARCARGIGRALAQAAAQPLRARDAVARASLPTSCDWRRDADPLTLLRRLNSRSSTRSPTRRSDTRVDSPIDDALKARGGRLSGPRAHHDRAGAPHRHPVPVCQRVSVARAPSAMTGRPKAPRTRGSRRICRRSAGSASIRRTMCSRSSGTFARRGRPRLRRRAADARRVPRRSGQRARRARHGVAGGLANAPGARDADDDVGRAWRRRAGRRRSATGTATTVAGCVRCVRCVGALGALGAASGREGMPFGFPLLTHRATCRARRSPSSIAPKAMRLRRVTSWPAALQHPADFAVPALGQLHNHVRLALRSLQDVDRRCRRAVRRARRCPVSATVPTRRTARRARSRRSGGRCLLRDRSASRRARVSLVISSRPVDARSRRPTGTTRASTSEIRSYTVARPSGSLRVVTTLRGLLSAMQRHVRVLGFDARDLNAGEPGRNLNGGVGDDGSIHFDFARPDQLVRLRARGVGRASTVRERAPPSWRRPSRTLRTHLAPLAPVAPFAPITV